MVCCACCGAGGPMWVPCKRCGQAVCINCFACDAADAIYERYNYAAGKLQGWRSSGLSGVRMNFPPGLDRIGSDHSEQPELLKGALHTIWQREGAPATFCKTCLGLCRIPSLAGLHIVVTVTWASPTVSADGTLDYKTVERKVVEWQEDTMPTLLRLKRSLMNKLLIPEPASAEKAASLYHKWAQSDPAFSHFLNEGIMSPELDRSFTLLVPGDCEELELLSSQDLIQFLLDLEPEPPSHAHLQEDALQSAASECNMGTGPTWLNKERRLRLHYEKIEDAINIKPQRGCCTIQ